MSLGAKVIGKLHQQHAKTHHDAHHHDAPHDRLNIQAGSGEEQHPGDPNGAEWNGEHDNERVEKRTELENHDQVHQNHRQDESEAKRFEGFSH